MGKKYTVFGAIVFAGLLLQPVGVRAAAGDIDTTFGSGAAFSGTAITTFGTDAGQRSAIRSIVQLPDGKLLAAGYNRATSSSNYDFALVRYDANGIPDTTFGTNAWVVTAIGTGDDQGNALVRQPDGKLVVAGVSHNGTNNDFAIVRYNADGSLDTTFSGDGLQTTDFAGSNDYGNSLALQADGKLVVAGYSNDGSRNRIALARYNTDGSLDETFDSDGRLLASAGTSNTIGNSVIQQADGKLVVGGSVRPATLFLFALFRFNPDGQLDTTFNSTGYVTTALGTNDFSGSVGRSVIQQADGKLLLAGDSWNTSTYNDFALARYNNNGSLDTTFSGDGLQTTDISGVSDSANQVLQLEDGRLVVVGNGYMAPSNADFVVLRYLADGALDTTFSADGKATTGVSNYDDFAYAAVAQLDGKLVLAGSAAPAGARFGLARFFNEPDSDADGLSDSRDAFPANLAAAIDADADGYPDAWAANCGAACQASSGLTIDTSLDDGDNDGLIDSEDAVAGDNNPPVVTAPPAIAVTSTGAATTIALGTATATDFVDGALSAIPDTAGGTTSPALSPGRHIITWSATDAAGNAGTATQQVDVVPLASFTAAAQTAGEGSLITVAVTLNGNAVAYPVKIPLLLDAASTGTNPGDHDATSATLVIAADADPANSASYQFVAGDDGLGGEPDRSVIFRIVADNGLDALAGAAIDSSHDDHEVTITEYNVAPAVTDIVIFQAGMPVNTISTTAGAVTITATVVDPNPLDNHVVSWSSGGIPLAAYAVGNDLVMDPSELPVVGGAVVLVATAADDGAPMMVSPDYTESVSVVTPASATVQDSGGGTLSIVQLLLLLSLALARQGKMERRRGC